MLGRETIVTVPDVTGSAGVTHGSAAFTDSTFNSGSGTNGYFWQFSGANDWYKQVSFSGPNFPTLEKTYQGTSATVAYTLRKFFYSLSSSADKIIDIRNWNTPLKLIQVDVRTLDDLRPNPQSASAPYGYVAYGVDSSGNIQISPYPFPTDARLFEVRTIIRPTDGTISIPNKYAHAIAWGAIAVGFAYLRKFDAAQAWSARFEQKIMEMRQQDRGSEDLQGIFRSIDSVQRARWLNMPEQYPVITSGYGPLNFKGGYSPGHPFIGYPQGQGYASTMRNCRFSNGCVIPRWAQILVNSSSLGSTKYVNGLAAWIDSTNSVTALVATCNGAILTADATTYFPSGAGIAFTARTGAVTISSSAGVRYAFDSLNAILIGVGNSVGGGVPFKLTAYNTNAAVLGGSPPSGDAIKQVNNFLFISRDLSAASKQSRVYWSNVGDPETWAAASFIDFNKSDGEPVMALGSIGTDLYIFKQTSIGRFSTVSLSVSGTVTLGPLVTVVKGVGCAGPLAVDNLPNGNLVFLGYNGHFYEYDGFTVLDRSCPAYPGPNAYFSSNNANNCGLSVGVANAQSLVKCWKGNNEVWIAFDSNSSGASNLYNVFVYDYINQIWAGVVTDTTPKSFASIPIGGVASTFYEGQEILFHGNGNGNVYGRGNYLKKYPVDESGNPVEFRVGAIILTAKESTNFVPRLITYELNSTIATALFVGFDSYATGTSGLDISTLGTRVFAPIPMTEDSAGGSHALPTLLNLEWTGTGSGGTAAEMFILGNYYISDEIIR